MMTRDSIYRLHRRQVPQNQFLRPLPRQAKSPRRPFDMRSIYHTPPRREHLDSMETYADDRDNGSPQLDYDRNGSIPSRNQNRNVGIPILVGITGTGIF